MNAKLLYDGIMICKLNGTRSSASVSESQWKNLCHFCSVGHQQPTYKNELPATNNRTFAPFKRLAACSTAHQLAASTVTGKQVHFENG